MTTAELIKLLQEEDPGGNAHVRVSGGVITGAQLKEGYWDGAYSYIQDGKYITSRDGMKVDLWTESFEDFIWNDN